ncbi:MAG: hypothetical protein ACYC99_14735 [Candidatus Geothermincolia bacterium]
MKTRLKRRLSLALVTGIVIAAVLAVGLTQAVAAPADATVGKQLKQGKGENVEARLDKIKKRIEAAIAKLEQLKDKKLGNFKTLEDKVKKAADTYASKGQDVTKLRADLEALNAKVAGAGKEVDAIIADLKNAESLATAETLDKFKAAAKDAMSKRRALVEQIREIKEYAKTVIRPELKSLAGKAGKSPTDSPK